MRRDPSTAEAEESCAAAKHPVEEPSMRIILFVLGWIFVVFGAAGIIVPVLPTTPFMLLAIWCFARSSPRFEAWLYGHPLFGPPLVAWRDRREIPRGAKVIAIACMAAGFALLVLVVGPPWFVSLAVGVVLLACSTFIATRNERRR